MLCCVRPIDDTCRLAGHKYLLAVAVSVVKVSEMLLVYYRETPPASLCEHQRPRCPTNIHSTRRQAFPGCGTEKMEQFALVIATA